MNGSVVAELFKENEGEEMGLLEAFSDGLIHPWFNGWPIDPDNCLTCAKSDSSGMSFCPHVPYGHPNARVDPGEGDNVCIHGYEYVGHEIALGRLKKCEFNRVELANYFSGAENDNDWLISAAVHEDYDDKVLEFEAAMTQRSRHRTITERDISLLSPEEIDAISGVYKDDVAEHRAKRG